MPLIRGPSKVAVGENIKREMAAGKSQKQSVAIALDVQRRSRADGGGLSSDDKSWLEQMARAVSGGKDRAQRAFYNDTRAGLFNPNYPPDNANPTGGLGESLHDRRIDNMYDAQSISDAVPRAPDPSVAPVEGFAAGGISQMPWYARSAARGVMIHAGPINSPVAGRTDHIPLNVASGSYVIPADIVSGIGQGNTAAGHHVINTMFHSAPYGGPVKPIGSAHAQIPRLSSPARPMKFASGGVVPIMAAGGEHVLTPDQVAALGGGDIDEGHKTLDAWVKYERDKINKEQRKLPGPAKD